MIPILMLALLAAGGAAGYRYWTSHRYVAGHVPLRPIPPNEVAGHVREIARIDPGEWADPFHTDEALVAFARHVAASKSSAIERADAIVNALQARKQKKAFVEWTRVEPREGPPLTAADTWRSLARDNAQLQRYPFEIASLAVAALRAVDVPAMLVEIYRYPNERAPLDPSGRLGYYGVFVGDAEHNAGRVFDPYGGRTAQPSAKDFVILDDVRAVGAALTLRALQRFDSGGDLAGAWADSDAARKLSPKSPSTHSARAQIWLAKNGGAEEGKRELNEAFTLRSDAARHNNLAIYSLSQMDAASAAGHVKAALDEAPD
ncbi:MAG TPA: hypothetical protein VGI70_00745, partial [Polyangiales bacterium]